MITITIIVVIAVCSLSGLLSAALPVGCRAVSGTDTAKSQD